MRTTGECRPRSSSSTRSPGRGPRLHRHPYGELFFVLEGEATFFDGAKHHVVGPGGVVLVPPRQPHAFRSSGSSRLRQIDVHLSSRFVTEWLEQDPGEPSGEDRSVT